MCWQEHQRPRPPAVSRTCQGKQNTKPDAEQKHTAHSRHTKSSKERKKRRDTLPFSGGFVPICSSLCYVKGMELTISKLDYLVIVPACQFGRVYACLCEKCLVAAGGRAVSSKHIACLFACYVPAILYLPPLLCVLLLICVHLTLQ